jgi:hypothetical protein
MLDALDHQLLTADEAVDVIEALLREDLERWARTRDADAARIARLQETLTWLLRQVRAELSRPRPMSMQ